MDWQLITVLGMFLFSLLYLATLYHLAHGRERQAMEAGARVVLEALTRDGRIMAEAAPNGPGEPVNIGEVDFEMPHEEPASAIPEVIIARNERMAQQLGERITDDLLNHAGLNK